MATETTYWFYDRFGHLITSGRGHNEGEAYMSALSFCQLMAIDKVHRLRFYREARIYE